MTEKYESHLRVNGSSENGWFDLELHKCKSPKLILSEKKNEFVCYVR